MIISFSLIFCCTVCYIKHVQKELAPDGCTWSSVFQLNGNALKHGRMFNLLLLQMTGWRIELRRNSSVLETFDPTSKSWNEWKWNPLWWVTKSPFGLFPSFVRACFAFFGTLKCFAWHLKTLPLSLTNFLEAFILIETCTGICSCKFSREPRYFPRTSSGVILWLWAFSFPTRLVNFVFTVFNSLALQF